MNDLIVKEVDFNGDTLVAAQDKRTGKIYVGVSWICKGIGFDKNQKDRQVKNVQSDIVLKRGCVKFDAGGI
jgi:anti-repressor protein